MGKRNTQITPPPPSNKLIDNPFFILGLVFSAVLLLIVGAEWFGKQGIVDKKEPQKSEDSTNMAELAVDKNPAKSKGKTKIEKKIPALKTKIENAKDSTALNAILKELKRDSATIVNADKENRAEFSDLIKLLQRKKAELLKVNPIINEQPIPTPVPEKPKSLIAKEVQSFIGSTAFDAAATAKMRQQYKGMDTYTLDALETYEAICQHKADYQHILSALRKMSDDSYYEKSERLLKHKFKGKSIDDLEEVNWNFTDNKPAWMTAAQEAEIKRWWDEIDEEVERLDSDY
jgi:hypothetical protein